MRRHACIVGLSAAITLWGYAPSPAWAQANSIGNQMQANVEIEGDIEVLYEDRDKGSSIRHFLKENGRRRELRLTTNTPALHTGDHVHVSGTPQPDGSLQLSGDGSSVQTLSAAQQTTIGAQSTIVLLVNFERNAQEPYTTTEAESVMSQVSDHYWLGSYEQTSVVARVEGWFTIAYDSNSCDATTLARLADQAAASAGVDLSPYRHRVYAFPQIKACSWWGVGTVGGNPSQAWVNGTFAKKVVGHEMGHNLGLYHSKAYECGSVTLGKNCSIIEYGNTLDIMGNPSTGNFNLFAKEQIGWINAGVSPPLTNVKASGVYWLGPYEDLDGFSKGLKVLKSVDPVNGVKTFYYVELRQPTGNDMFLSNNTNVKSGVVISLGTENDADTDLLLDMTPETGSWSDPALVAGRRFVDPDTGVEIQALSIDSSGATIGVVVPNVAPVASILLNTTSPKTNDVLTARATTFDGNGDTVTLTFVWRVNAIIKKTTAATSSLTDTFDLGINGQGDPGNVITVEVTPFDGLASGSTVSASAKVQRKKK